MPPPSARPGSRSVGLGCAIALATFALFASSLRNGFIELFDDTLHVLANEHVLEGLGARGVAWAFTTTHAYNWHPLTWLSHMADVSLFGLEPWGHHLSSALLHAGCAVLVFALARSFGLAAWTAAFAAGAFAFHPLRVQSVAWVAGAEGRPLRRARARRPPAVGSLGTVTDEGSLRRRPWSRSRSGCSRSRCSSPSPRYCSSSTCGRCGGPGRMAPDLAGRILEKVPFAAPSVVCAGTTLALQSFSRAAQGNDAFSLADRLANAAVAPFAYLAKIAWADRASPSTTRTGARRSRRPSRSRPQPASPRSPAFRLAVRTRAPYLLVGWGWFLVMPLPVIGIVQAGRQGMADRYTYLPAIGLVLALAALGEDVLRAFRTEDPRTVAGAVAAVVLTALETSTYVELGEVARRRDAVPTRGDGHRTERARSERARGPRRAEGTSRRRARAVCEGGRVRSRLRRREAELRLAPPRRRASSGRPRRRRLQRRDSCRPTRRPGMSTAWPWPHRGRLAEAVGEFELAVSLRPGDASARAALAQARGQLGATQRRAAP